MGVNSVRYENPAQGRGPDWARLLSGLIQGGAGQIAMNQQQQAQQQQNGVDFLKAVGPGFASTQQLGFGDAPPEPGNYQMPQSPGLPKMFVKPAPAESGSLKNYWDAKLKEKEYGESEMDKWINAFTKDAASKATLLAAFDPVKNPLDKSMASVMKARDYFKKQGQAQAATQDSNPKTVGGKIMVRRKSDGLVGTLLPNEFDPAEYEKVN
jgi:hypothetical protein